MFHPLRRGNEGRVPDRRLGVVILINRGDQYPHEIGRKFLVDLARAQGN